VFLSAPGYLCFGVEAYLPFFFLLWNWQDNQGRSRFYDGQTVGPFFGPPFFFDTKFPALRRLFFLV